MLFRDLSLSAWKSLQKKVKILSWLEPAGSIFFGPGADRLKFLDLDPDVDYTIDIIMEYLLSFAHLYWWLSYSALLSGNLGDNYQVIHHIENFRTQTWRALVLTLQKFSLHDKLFQLFVNLWSFSTSNIPVWSSVGNNKVFFHFRIL